MCSFPIFPDLFDLCFDDSLPFVTYLSRLFYKFFVQVSVLICHSVLWTRFQSVALLGSIANSSFCSLPAWLCPKFAFVL